MHHLVELVLGVRQKFLLGNAAVMVGIHGAGIEGQAAGCKVFRRPRNANGVFAVRHHVPHLGGVGHHLFLRDHAVAARVHGLRIEVHVVAGGEGIAVAGLSLRTRGEQQEGY